ncbi:MAG: acetate kinase [Treponemataceae bacterium]
MVILTLNCGSSSAKYQLYDWANKDVLAFGVIERIGGSGANIEHNAKGKDTYQVEFDCKNHTNAIEKIMTTITDPSVGVIKNMSEVKAVGHRVVHGGEKFTKSVLITPEVIESFRSIIPLAPLHEPANLLGIEAAQKVLPNVPHAAIMDTAWHQTMPPSSFMYAIPHEWYEKYAARRYGFHGTSYVYTAKRASVILDKDPQKTNLVILHIGNGSSCCAVKNGCCHDTSMGLTPLEGLVMGTRCGDVDPALPLYIMNRAQMSASEVDSALNKNSGLLGITGQYVDRRDVQAALEKGDKKALLAQDIECYRLKKYIGSYIAGLGCTPDAIVFTAGVGEFAHFVREKACKGLEHLGIKIDTEKNKIARTRNAEMCISADDSKIKILVIPTDEELVMTEDTYALTQGTYDVHTKFTYSFQAKDYVNKARAEGFKKDLEKNPALKTVLAIK